MAQTYLPWWIGMIKSISVFGGNQVDSAAHQERLVTGPLGSYWASLLEKSGKSKIIAPLLYSTQAGYITTRPVQNPGDLAGMKIRIPSKVLSAEVTALGGTPTVLSSADVYMGLQRGTIQGAVSGLGSFFSRKWYEAAKHVIIVRPMPSYFHIVANLKWFNSLPEKHQQIILEAGVLATMKSTDRSDQLRLSGLSLLQRHWGPG